MSDHHCQKKSKHQENRREKNEQQLVWSWGAGNDGQLATGALLDEPVPQVLTAFVAFPIRNMSCGGAHGVAVSQNGEVATWGRGQAGQLGHGNFGKLTKPTVLKSFHRIKVCNVAAGWSHTAFVTDSGNLFTCGDGGFGQLGHGNFNSVSLPTKVAELALMHVSMAACGMRHTLVLIKSGESSIIFAFGAAKRGQLGILFSGQQWDKSKSGSVTTRINLPQRVTSLDHHNIVTAHCNGDHCVALSESGDLYLWGRGFNGNPDIFLPSRVSSELKFLQVAVGWNHGLALTDAGKVYSWGGGLHSKLSSKASVSTNRLKLCPGSFKKRDALADSCKMEFFGRHNGHGSLQLSPTNSDSVNDAKRIPIPGSTGETEPSTLTLDLQMLGFEIVEGLEEVKVVCVATGAEHSAVALDDGAVMTWGWGEHGQLGLGTSDDRQIPQRVQLAFQWQSDRSYIFCGSGFTFVCSELEAEYGID